MSLSTVLCLSVPLRKLHGIDHHHIIILLYYIIYIRNNIIFKIIKLWPWWCQRTTTSTTLDTTTTTTITTSSSSSNSSSSSSMQWILDRRIYWILNWRISLNFESRHESFWRLTRYGTFIYRTNIQFLCEVEASTIMWAPTTGGATFCALILCLRSCNKSSTISLKSSFDAVLACFAILSSSGSAMRVTSSDDPTIPGQDVVRCVVRMQGSWYDFESLPFTSSGIAAIAVKRYFKFACSFASFEEKHLLW